MLDSTKSILEITAQFIKLFPRVSLWHQFSYLSNTHFFKVNDDSIFDMDSFLNFYFTTLPYYKNLLKEDITFVGSKHIITLDEAKLLYDAQVYLEKENIKLDLENIKLLGHLYISVENSLNISDMILVKDNETMVSFNTTDISDYKYVSGIDVTNPSITSYLTVCDQSFDLKLAV